jgi:hypothetical protein
VDEDRGETPKAASAVPPAVRKVARWFVTFLTILVAVGLGSPVATAASCAPTITPGESINRVAASCPGGTTFTIKDGAYKLTGSINADSRDTYKGIYSDGSRPTINANGAEAAFLVGGTNGVNISGLDVTGAKGGDYCEPACGSAIKGDGTNMHVSNVRLHHNVNQGIGNPGHGFLLENSEIDHNGSYSFTILDRNNGKEPSSSAGIKVLEGSATFRNNRIHDNYWIGIWCDERGGPLVATGNNIYNNGKVGIQYETCTGSSTRSSAITNNTITHNGYMNANTPTPKAGILGQDPQSLEVAHNTIADHPQYGIHVVKSTRQQIFGVKIHDNRLRNDTVQGCGLSGVLCFAN